MGSEINNNIKNNRDIIASSAEFLKDAVSSGKLTEADCPVRHMFAKGCYIREIFMPAGSMVIGKIHKTEHFNTIIKGSVVVVTQEGIDNISGPATFVSKAGIQKCVYVEEDCIWQTIHITDKTDISEIEKDVIADDYDSLESKLEEKPCLG